jgi:hypothetical protein
MADLWMPQAEHYDLGDHAPTDGGPAKAIAHITADRPATIVRPQQHVSFGRLLTYFTGSGRAMAPHILWDPFTGQFAQFYPANSRSKSVMDLPGGTRTNRAGRVVLQIEAVFFPYTLVDGRVYASLVDTPCKGWSALHAWVRSHGVPDIWPMGRPTSFAPHRSERTWETTPGWYGHAQVPENDHVDPGSWPAFLAVKPTPKPSAPSTPARPPLPTRTRYPYPTGIRPGASDPSAKNLQRALKATGWMARDIPLSDHYGPLTQKGVAGFNQKHDLNSIGRSYDPAIGPKGWALLMRLAHGVA